MKFSFTNMSVKQIFSLWLTYLLYLTSECDVKPQPTNQLTVFGICSKI